MVIPAINAETFEEVRKKISMVENEADWIHVDVADGKFTPNKLWNNPEDLKNLKTHAKIEVHLMVEKPEDEIDRWIASGAHRLIIHVESTERTQKIIEKCRKAGVEVAIALNPETPAEIADLYVRDVVFVQTLGVPPGKSGQAMDERLIYEKIRALRGKFPDLQIEIDGGVNIETARKAKEAGATLFVAASAIFGEPDPLEALKALREAII